MSDANVQIEVAATAGSPIKKVAPVEAGEPSKNGNGTAVEAGEASKNGNGATASPSKKDQAEMLQDALQNVAAGKRHLLVADPNAAVTSLALACEQLGTLYGETSKECGEAYFYYGKALLELARLEAGVIDEVLDGVPDTDDEKEDSSFVEGPTPTEAESEKIADEVDGALQENYKDLEKVEKEREAKKAADKAKENGNSKDEPMTNGEAKENGKDEPMTNGAAKENSKDEPLTNGEANENGDAEAEAMDVKNDSEENSEEEEGAEAENADEAAKENTEEAAEPEAGTSKDGETENADDEEEDGKENESIGSNDAGPSTAKDTTDQAAIDQEDEEDPSNLQLAWEMLELAKAIFTKHADSLATLSPTRLELEAKLSETYQTLGEVSIENENYPQAIEDLTMCLRRRQELLPEDSRSIAETHYQLGVAMGFNLQFDEAVGALNDAIYVLEKRVSNLKEKKESQDPAKKDDAFYSREREITEIEGVVPEIVEKIADTKDMQNETFKKLGDRRLMEEAISSAATTLAKATDLSSSDGLTSSSATIEESTSKKAAGSISHLIKKRKKSDEDVPAENGDVKKPHLEDKGKAVVVASTNGHADSSSK